MIRGFGDRSTAAVLAGICPKGMHPNLAKAARAKLRMIDAAEQLSDLREPPGNRLEALSGTRAGQHSVRINDQWRVCFEWCADGAHRVSIVDYHR